MRGTPSTPSPDARATHPGPAMDPGPGREAGAARIAAITDAATGAARARTPEELAGVLRRACAAARPCEGFRFATYDAAADTLRYLTAFPALAAGDDETGWRAVRERRPQATEPRDGVPAVLSAPAMADGEALGVLVTTAAGGFHPDDEKMVEALAAIAGGALARLRLARDHRGAKDAVRSRKVLEQRVEERTRELAHANDALAAEVQQHRAARASAPCRPGSIAVFLHHAGPNRARARTPN